MTDYFDLLLQVEKEMEDVRKNILRGELYGLIEYKRIETISIYMKNDGIQ